MDVALRFLKSNIKLIFFCEESTDVRLYELFENNIWNIGRPKQSLQAARWLFSLQIPLYVGRVLKLEYTSILPVGRADTSYLS